MQANVFLPSAWGYRRGKNWFGGWGGWVKSPEEACIKERKGLDTGGSSMSRGQVCVKVPGLNEGWSWRGQASWEECQGVKLVEEQEPVYEGCHRFVFFKSPFTRYPPDGHSRTVKAKRTCRHSFIFAFSLQSSCNFYSDYMWKRAWLSLFLFYEWETWCSVIYLVSYS